MQQQDLNEDSSTSHFKEHYEVCWVVLWGMKLYQHVSLQQPQTNESPRKTIPEETQIVFVSLVSGAVTAEVIYEVILHGLHGWGGFLLDQSVTLEVLTFSSRVWWICFVTLQGWKWDQLHPAAQCLLTTCSDSGSDLCVSVGDGGPSGVLWCFSSSLYSTAMLDVTSCKPPWRKVQQRIKWWFLFWAFDVVEPWRSRWSWEGEIQQEGS